MFKLEPGAAHRALCEAFPKQFSLSKGTRVSARPQAEPGFGIAREGDALVVRHATRSDWFRALGELLRDPMLQTLTVKPELDERGLMIDASRNGVPHVASLEQRIIELALLGINQITLYTEDTYEVEGHPLVGYLRGPYSATEIRRVVRFAKQFGIEMYPCIQTLAHLEQVLQYKKAYGGLRDTASVLSVKAKGTRDFVAQLIDSASAPYESRRIHVGMDEPWDLGRGSVFQIGKAIDPRELYLTHLRMVSTLCDERGLQPVAWGDFVLGQHAFNGDVPMTPAQWRKIPKNLTLDYWEYFSENRSTYERDVARFREHGFEPIVSPALWNWDRFWGIYDKARRTFEPMLLAAKATGVRRALMTMWGDDGQEAPYRSNFPGLVCYAEHCFRKQPNDRDIASMVQAVAGDSLASFTLPTALDCPDAVALQKNGNLAKTLTWDDPLLGMFASHLGKRSLGEHYRKLSVELRGQAKRAAPRNRALFQLASELATSLTWKSELHASARRAYKSGERRALLAVANDAGKAIGAMQRLWRAHRKAWLEEQKPFGLEVLDLRYGGQIGRLSLLRDQLRAHAAGKLAEIPELAAKPHNYLGDWPHHGRKYRGTASPQFNIWV